MENIVRLTKQNYETVDETAFQLSLSQLSDEDKYKINAVLILFSDQLTKQTAILDKDVTDFLISKCVLLSEDREEIEKHSTASKRNSTLIHLLKDRPFDTTQPLIEALSQSDDQNLYTAKIILDMKRLLHGECDKVSEYIGNENVSDHKVKLQKNYKLIVQKTICSSVCDHLFASGVISFEDKEEISAGCFTSSERNRRLLGKLLRKDINAYTALLEAYIMNSQYKNIAKQIEETEVTLQEKQMIQTGMEIRLKRLKEVQNSDKTLPEGAPMIPPRLTLRRSVKDEMIMNRSNTKPCPPPLRSKSYVDTSVERINTVQLFSRETRSLTCPLPVDNQLDTKRLPSVTQEIPEQPFTTTPGNVYDSDNNDISSVVEPEGLSCFHSSITREGAEDILSSKPVGSYLFRYSSDQSIKFAFSVLTERRIVHGRMSYCDGKYTLYATNSYPLVFESFREVAEFLKEGIHFTESGFFSANTPVNRKPFESYYNIKL